VFAERRWHYTLAVHGARPATGIRPLLGDGTTSGHMPLLGAD
jgi:hypothetical protein